MDTFANHLRELGGQYLIRLAHLGSRRVLAAFCTLARQDPGVAHRDTPLERLYAVLGADDRRKVRDALSQLGIFPGWREASSSSGRNRRRPYRDGSDPYLWGISPFD